MTVTELRLADAHPTPNDSAPVDYLPLRALLRERLAASPVADPDGVVDDVLADLPEELVLLAARKGLGMLAQEIVRVDRAPRPPSNESAKWNGAAAVVAEHRDLFEERIWTGEEWKFLGDCAKQDLLSAAKVKRARAVGYIENAEREERLARKLKRDQVVRDLPVEKVEEVWNA